MYCRIKNVECSHAGDVGCFNEEKSGIDHYTICYKEGGRLACTLGL